ncbi:MAG TPA: hypothetical protein ENF64_02735 [Hadesarchaea archaeon]|nr:hypothetical protein [Hadesarchaea archaeon]
MGKIRLAIFAGFLGVLVFLTVFYLILGSPSTETPPPSTPSVQLGGSLEDNIKLALGEKKGISTEKIDIQFYVSTENQDLIAAGAVIDNRGSVLLFYDSISREVSIYLDAEAENEEIAAAWAICSQITSEWSGKKLVPHGFSKVEDQNAYHFMYVDDYLPEWTKWSMGMAMINMDNQEITWVSSF